MKHGYWFVGASLAVAAACVDSVGPDFRESSYGIITISASSETPGGTPVQPTAVFFLSTTLALPSSRLQEDACQVRPFIAEVSPSRFLDAGDSIVVATTQATAFLRRPVPPAPPIYSIPSPGVSVQLGSQVTFTVPGSANGFPASSITARTAEPFQFTPIPTSIAQGENLALAWTPGGDNESTMVVSLQYASPGSPVPNSEVFCSLIDDGTHTLDASFLDAYRSSSVNLRVNRAYRLRTSAKVIGNAIMLAMARFDVVIQDAP